MVKRLELTPDAEFIAKEQSENQWAEDSQEVKNKWGMGDLLLLGRWWKVRNRARHWKWWEVLSKAPLSKETVNHLLRTYNCGS